MHEEADVYASLGAGPGNDDVKWLTGRPARPLGGTNYNAMAHRSTGIGARGPGHGTPLGLRWRDPAPHARDGDTLPLSHARDGDTLSHPCRHYSPTGWRGVGGGVPMSCPTNGCLTCLMKQLYRRLGPMQLHGVCYHCPDSWRNMQSACRMEATRELLWPVAEAL